MSSLPPQRRAALGYGKSELIKQCSFNSMQCDIEKEFKLHIDPSFGNCYTFNANPDRVLASSRAGPSYGEESKPVCQVVAASILTVPLPLGYIYKDYSYEPEGCYRNCYQKRIINQCRCADPRFPKPSDRVKTYSAIFEMIYKRNVCRRRVFGWLSESRADVLMLANRMCILLHIRQLNGHQEVRVWNATKRIALRTTSAQPRLFSTFFSRQFLSSFTFPSRLEKESQTKNFLQSDDRHAAMLEIYYEQMSYEVLRESESYSIVNLVSDIGGQMGLWLGASVLTAVEIVIFLFNIVVIAITGRLRSNDSLTKEKQPEEHTKNPDDHLSSPTKKCYDNN
ncbi:Amiloride-sensitive sodium channel [Ostertagia ostertagi]